MIHTHELKMTTTADGGRESLIYALLNLAVDDDDFNGNNGKDYLWEVAEEKGFKSNLEYVEDDLRKLPIDWSADQIMSRFFELWLGSDSYYDSYDFDWVSVPSGQKVISVSYVREM